MAQQPEDRQPPSRSVAWDGSVYVLGAGCSVDDGGPLFDNFRSAAERTLAEADFLDPSMKDFFANELDWWARQYPDFNVEQLFAQYELQALMEQDPDNFGTELPFWTGDLSTMQVLTNGSTHRAHLQYVIAKTLHHCIHQGESVNYGRFVDEVLAPQEALALTTNWDTLLPRAARRRGLRVVDASDTYPRRELLRPSRAIVLPMHGTLDTWICRSCRAPLSIPEEEGVAIIEQIRRAPACPCGGRIYPSMVPPTLAKFGAGTPHTVPVARNWNSAANLAMGARRLVLIGYSLPMTDIQFHSFLRYVRTFTQLEAVEVVGPHPHDIADRMARALGPGAPTPIPIAKTFAQWLEAA